MASTFDPFRPRHEPALSIYEAFQKEAVLRKERAVEVWIEAEIQVVHEAAIAKAREMGLRAPSRGDIEHAEGRARGHTDYGLKWALGVVESMRVASAG